MQRVRMVTRLSSAGLGGASAKRLSGQVSKASLLVLVAVIATLFGGLIWSSQRSDLVSIERQERVARHALEVALDELAQQQETVAVWDESAARMVAPKKDHEWLLHNMGGWLFKIFKHDEAILLDADGKLVQAVAQGKIVPPSRARPIEGAIAELLKGVRGELTDGNGVHDRTPGKPLAANSTVLTTPRAVHDTHMMLVDGRPAAVSAMLIKPSTPGYVGEHDRWPILISIRYLDGSFMAELQRKYLIEDARFATVPAIRAGEYAVPFHTSKKRQLGYLIWTPALPGSRIMSTLVPLNLGAMLLLSLLMSLLLLRLNQTLKERGDLEERATRLAFRDALTDLPNRSLLAERLADALVPVGKGSSVALLLIDLDRFKQVNDTLGHLAGDEMIVQFASRLEDALECSGTIGRLGGDEFAIVLPGYSAADAMNSCELVLSLFAKPFDLGGHQLYGGASIGAVHVMGEEVDGSELMRRADVALYRAKAAGRNCARMYAAPMDAETQRRSALERELRAALGSDQFSLWSQPLVNPEGVPMGHELLLRWDHPEFGTVSPSQIIPVAEETGLIHPIGDWILAEAIGVASRSHESLFTAVNLSPVQLRDERFADRILALCRSKGVDPARIELEITEQVLMEDDGAVRESLMRLRTAGFRLALDDFGTGYSSLSYLRQFTVDKIKIDRSFVADVCGSADARAIVAAIVTLGQALGLTIVAEGVETEKQADLLRMAGCDQLQGHYFAEPARLVRHSLPGAAKAVS